MIEKLLTHSVALFGDCQNERTVPASWLTSAVALFQEHDLSPVLFTASGGGFEFDDCYLLGNANERLTKWEEVIVGRQQQLVQALQGNAIAYLGLDSPRADAAQRSEARACIDVDARNGELYVGVETRLVSDPGALIRWACDQSKSLFNPRYGIAYQMPLADDPASYSVGARATTFAEFKQWLRERRSGIRRPPTPDELWADELRGRRRHLSGLFRRVYPANILSEAHVRGANLTEQSVGRLSKLDDSLWLWELSDAEIPQAEAMLEEKQLLVRQAD